MKATELRIGNFVSVDGKNLPVTQIFEKGLNCGNVGALYELVKPIPLTEDWLERFNWNPPKDIGVSFSLTTDDIHFVAGNYYKKIEYVYQLQNLYFALTGEELNQNKEDANSTDNFNSNSVPSV